MEENSTLAPDNTQKKQQGCISCGNPQILYGFPNALCAECREKYIKYPIPAWVKIFGGGILALVAFLLFTLPKNLSAGINYERGVKAEQANNYFTEQKLMKGLVKDNPGYLEAKAHLLIAAFYNNDISTVGEMVDKMQNENFEDEVLLAKVNKVIDESKNYVPGDTLIKYMHQYPDSTGGIPESIYKEIISGDAGDVFTKEQYAAFLINKKEYVAADSLLKDILQKDEGYMPALQLKLVLLRFGRDTSQCLEFSNRLLAINREDVFAISCKARTYLRMKQPKLGLQYALQALKIDADDPYVKATLVLAYHFNNMLKERDDLIKAIKKGGDSTMSSYMEFPINVINHKDSI